MKTSKELHTFSVRLPADLFEQLKGMATRERRPLGSLVTDAVALHVERAQTLDRFELFSTQLAASAAQTMRASADSVEDKALAVIEQLSAIAVQQTGALDSLMARLDGLMATPSTVAPSRPAPPTGGWTPGKGVPD